MGSKGGVEGILGVRGKELLVQVADRATKGGEAIVKEGDEGARQPKVEARRLTVLGRH